MLVSRAGKVCLFTYPHHYDNTRTETAKPVCHKEVQLEQQWNSRIGLETHISQINSEADDC